jgi:hypothetical protein
MTKKIDYSFDGTLTGANFGSSFAFIPRKLSRMSWTTGEPRRKIGERVRTSVINATPFQAPVYSKLSATLHPMISISAI